MQIFVKACTGKTTEIRAEESDTVDCLKSRIQATEGTPQEQQALVYEKEKLEDGGRTLAQYRIQNKATLYLVLRLREEPEQRQPQPSDRELTVKTLRGESMTFFVPAGATILDVKRQVQERTGQLPEQQRLIAQGKQLDDAALVADVTVDPPVLFVIPQRVLKPITITIKLITGKAFEMQVDEKDKVEDVKLKIKHSEDLEPERQRLIFAGKQLENEKTLAEYGVAEGSTLHLVLRSANGAGGGESRYQPVSGACEVAGACGLYNMGNTCFMNSILQALSNTVPLRQYYRSGEFKGEISEAPLGMRGRLASGFAELLIKMWEDSHTVLAPSDLKTLIAEKRPEFGGFQQHDAQEVLTFLLDGLHEDVNRAPYPRPIVEDPSTAGKSDLQVASEAWQGNLRRNDSRVMDIFQFQVRSEISFPDVGDTSLKFDPMMYLTLPVPKPPHVVEVTVVHRGYPEVAPSTKSIEIPKSSTFADLQDRLFDVFPSKKVGYGRTCYAFANVYGQRVLKLWGAANALSELRGMGVVWAFEVAYDAGVPEEEIHFVAAQVRKASGSSSLSSSSPTYTPFAAPYVLAVRRSTGSGGSSSSTAEVMSSLRSAAEGFEKYFGASAGELKISMTSVGLFSADEGNDLVAEGVFELSSSEALSINFLDLHEVLPSAPPPPEPAAMAGPRPDMEVDLQQCLDAFTREEELAQDDWVKCSRTGSIERSVTKLDIWTAPECLLIHLKRFGSEQLGGPIEKVNTLVRAPLDLDLDPWLREPRPERGAQYKLYAVVNHSGTLSFGHYTAHCRVGDGEQRQWYHFNDSTVTRAAESEVMTRSAYILLYERVRSTCEATQAKGSN
mmetsp:Transcript_99083/g.317845  ORF Transcript_99083/g.317845 Transcript_99083/m.317845 type:complete len:842 (-) Transcript_99083:58-2583(-)